MTDQTPMFSGNLQFLSNFDTTPFHIERLAATAASGEHAFNALKTLKRDEQRRVLDAATPGLAKRQGRRVTLRPGWDAGVRVWAMQRVLTAKYAVPMLAKMLVATGDLQLVETNHWHDQFWGSCYCPKHVMVPGQNMLGELTMAVRVHLRG